MYIRPLPITRTFLWEYSPRVKGINGLSRKEVGKWIIKKITLFGFSH